MIFCKKIGPPHGGGGRAVLVDAGWLRVELRLDAFACGGFQSAALPCPLDIVVSTRIL